jgi:hypothetical protein
MAFMVNPVKPKVGFISGAVLSAIESFSPYLVGGYDGGRGAGHTGVRLPYMLPTTLLKVKRKFLIVKISVLYTAFSVAPAVSLSACEQVVLFLLSHVRE